jgi:hypothetical protein
MRMLLLAGALALIFGCTQSAIQPERPDAPDPNPNLFRPTTMRLHPIFTQVKSFTGGSTPDGIEAVLEFDDQFGDPTKAAGSVIFELFSFRDGFPDPRGNRLVQPWAASLTSSDQQQAHWRREISAYSFLLAWPSVTTNRNYVLTATYEPLTGTRLFARTIITGSSAPKSRPGE